MKQPPGSEPSKRALPASQQLCSRASTPPGALDRQLAASPRMVAQRHQVRSLFGPIAQRRSDGEAQTSEQAVLQARWVDGSNQGLPESDQARALEDPLSALLTFAQHEGLEDAESLAYRVDAAKSGGYADLLQSAVAWLKLTLQDPTPRAALSLLNTTLATLTLPDDGMDDAFHAEDDTGGNAEEELGQGDLALEEIGNEQQPVIAEALVKRHPDLLAVFTERAQAFKKEATPKLFLAWYNSGVLTRSQFKQLKPMQLARTPGTLSYQAGYASSAHGQYKDVTYKRDGVGSIDFGTTTKHKTWTNPMSGGVEVQLNQGSGNVSHGITLNGTKIKIVGASRGQHFSIANRIAKNGQGNKSPPNWTWHHLTSHYKMVLVDRVVHAKHGHNGGVHVWT